MRKAYLALAKKFHPDLNKSPNAHVQFQKIQEAYTTLQSNPAQETVPETEYKAEPRPRPTYRQSAGFPGGAEAYWKFQSRSQEQEFAREYSRAADERMRQAAENFDRAGFEINLIVDTVKKFLPIFFLPLTILAAAVLFSRSEPPEKFRVFWDSEGRAFAEDAFGQLVRAEPLDHRNNK